MFMKVPSKECSMRYSRADAGHKRLATIDIETTHYDPANGETVSVGIGIHERGTPARKAAYELFHRETADDERGLIETSLEYLDSCGADALVSFNGRDFDMAFLQDRLARLSANQRTARLDTPDTHIDLFEGRQVKCNQTGDKWPTLEECLAAYEFEVPETHWNGQLVTNVRFGRELGPAYLSALEAGDWDRASELQQVIEHYLITDLEANFAIYAADIGAVFEPVYLGPAERF